MEVASRGTPYSEMVPDGQIGALYQTNAEAIGREFPLYSEDAALRTAGSTDMANVSLVIPTIHPMLGLGCWPAVNHQPEFAAYCATAVADAALVDGALAMAWTAIDVSRPGPLRDRLLAGATL